VIMDIGGLDGPLRRATHRPEEEEITDSADIPQFNSHRIMRYVFPAIAEIHCETADNRLLLS